MNLIMFMQASPDILNWLLQQTPVVVIMGIVIYYLVKKLDKAETDKDELAKDVIKLTTLWEEKGDRLEAKGEKNQENYARNNTLIIELLREIKALVSK